MRHPGLVADSHVHFYTVADLTALPADLPYARPAPNPLSTYLLALQARDIVPVLLNNVHLSILPDSENVFASFRELEHLRQRHPGQFDQVRLVGTIKADPAYATEERLGHPQVVGVRIVLHDAPEDSIDPDAYRTPAWQALYRRLGAHQHLHVYAQSAATNLRVLRQVPDDVRVIIDHLGTCHAHLGASDGTFTRLLEAARRRGNVWFKGPGYRTSTDIAEVAPFVMRIVEAVGADKLLLQATDAPHVGTDPRGIAYGEIFQPAGAFDFVRQLADVVAQRSGLAADALLNGALPAVFPNVQANQPQADK
jgi:Predicted metal-dependent hydrolase of the TIM-barrel fold